MNKKLLILIGVALIGFIIVLCAAIAVFIVKSGNPHKNSSVNADKARQDLATSQSLYTHDSDCTPVDKSLVLKGFSFYVPDGFYTINCIDYSELSDDEKLDNEANKLNYYVLSSNGYEVLYVSSYTEEPNLSETQKQKFVDEAAEKQLKTLGVNKYKKENSNALEIDGYKFSSAEFSASTDEELVTSLGDTIGIVKVVLVPSPYQDEGLLVFYGATYEDATSTKEASEILNKEDSNFLTIFKSLRLEKP